MIIQKSELVHPITDGLGDFWVHDERYSNLDFVDESDIVPLYVHSEDGVTHPLVWARTVENSRVVQRPGPRRQFVRLARTRRTAQAHRVLAPTPRLICAGRCRRVQMHLTLTVRGEPVRLFRDAVAARDVRLET